MAEELSSRRHLDRRQQFSLAILTCFQLLDGFDLFALALVAGDIARQWSISVAFMGVILAMAQLGSIIAAITIGRLSERYGSQRLLLLVTAIFAASSLLTAIAWSPGSLLIARFAIGLGLGAAVPLTVGYISTELPAATRGTNIGIALAGLPAGQILCGIVAGIFVPSWGWRSLFEIATVTALVLFALIGCLPRDRHPQAMPPTREAPRGTAVPGNGPSHSYLSIMLVAAAAFVSALIIYFLFSWIPFLLTRSGLAAAQASACTSALAAGGLVGGLMWGRLSDSLPCHIVLGFAYVSGGLFMALLALPQLPWIAILLLCVGTGFFIFGAYASLSILIASLFPEGAHIRILGYSTVATRSAGLIAPIGTGLLLSVGVSLSAILFAATLLAFLVSAIVLLLGRTARWSAAAAGRASP